MAHVGDVGVLPDLHGLDEAAVDGEHLSRLAVDQKDPPAVGRDILEFLLGRLQTRVVLIAERMIGRSLEHVAAAPEFRDVDFPLRVGFQQQEGVELRRLHDRIDISEELAVCVGKVLDPLFSLAA